jgi:hypothetical protein
MQQKVMTLHKPLQFYAVNCSAPTRSQGQDGYVTIRGTAERKLRTAIQLAFPWIRCGTFFEVDLFFDLETILAPRSPALTALDRPQTRVFQTSAVMREELKTRVLEDTLAIPQNGNV